MVLQSDAEAALELWLASPAYQSRPLSRTGRTSRALLPEWARSDAASQLPLLTPPSTAVPLGAASPMPPHTAQVHKQDIGGLSAVQGCSGRAVRPCALACGLVQRACGSVPCQKFVVYNKAVQKKTPFPVVVPNPRSYVGVSGRCIHPQLDISDSATLYRGVSGPI